MIFQSSRAPLLISLDGYTHDGVWHTLSLSHTPSTITLSLDNDRIVGTIEHDGYSIVTDVLSIGGARYDNGRTIGLKGCVQRIEYDGTNVDLSSVMGDGVVSGDCDDGASCNEEGACPSSSNCVQLWRGHGCQCDDTERYIPQADTCDAPCDYALCGDGSCIADSGVDNGELREREREWEGKREGALTSSYQVTCVSVIVASLGLTVI